MFHVEHFRSRPETWPVAQVRGASGAEGWVPGACAGRLGVGEGAGNCSASAAAARLAAHGDGFARFNGLR